MDKVRYFKNGDNILLNFEKWQKKKSSNILFVIGLSGSGKTTAATKIAKEHGAILVSLDDLGTEKGRRIKIVKQCQDNISKDFIKEYKNKDKQNKLYKQILGDVLDAAFADGDNLYVFEGIQIYTSSDGEPFKNDPIMIINTSMVNSILRRFKRESKSGKIEWSKELQNEFFKLIRWYIDSVKDLNKFKSSLI